MKQSKQMACTQDYILFAVGIALIFFQTGNYWSATWLSKWTLLIGLWAVAFSLWAAKRTSLFHLPLMLYTFGSLGYLGLWPQSPYSTVLDSVTVLAIQKNAVMGMLQVIACLTLFVLLKKKGGLGAATFLASLWAIGAISTLCLPGSGNHSPPNDGLWFGNPSMGASLLACCLPFVWALSRSFLRPRAHQILVPITWVLTLFMIYRTRASVPWGVLGAVTAADIFARKWKKFPKLSVAAISVLGAAMITLGMVLLKKDFWDQNRRFEIWRMGWDWFWLHAHPSVGFGYGSTQILLPVEQTITGHYWGDYFLWFHNDWLQLAVEGGWIGMTCVFLSLARLISISWKYPALFASLVGFCTLACFNYPLRMPIHCFVLALICGMAEGLVVRKDFSLTEWVARGHLGA